METTVNGVIKATSNEIYNVDPFNNNATILDEHLGKVASESALGHIKIGTGLDVVGGIANVKIANDLTTDDSSTALSAKMGVELNTNIVNTNSKLAEHADKVASETTLGHIKIGAGLQMTDGVASVNLSALIDKMYPIGSVYISVNNVSPAEFLGGTWERFAAGRTLIGIDVNNVNYSVAEKIGGSETTILEANNMPSHTHGFSSTGKPSGTASTSVSIAADGNHYHTAGALSANDRQLTGRIANIVVQGSGGLNAYDVFTASLGGGTGYYGGNTNGGTNCLDAFDMNATHGHSIGGNTEWGGYHGHGASATTSLSFNDMTVSGNTSASGNGQAFNNLQPYITSYMWKRVA